MDHTHIVQAVDLDGYANTINSQAVIPELLYWLVKQSITNASVCRIPYGDAINQPGWDGIVQAESAFLEFVPAGTSYWEVGTGSSPQGKASDEFNKRSKEVSAKDRAGASFVFVTPRFREWGEPQQTQWIKNRNDRGWRQIRIIDGVKLADWLREFPSVGRWIAKRMGLTETLGGFSTPRDHWENIKALTALGDPPLPPKLFTEGRGNVRNALQALFEGKESRLFLFAESPTDVGDFVAAHIETFERETARSLAYRCLYVSEEDAWRSVVALEKSHVLVAGPRLGLETLECADLLTMATRGGHAVVVPLCGAWAEGRPEIIKLRSPSQAQIQTILKEAGYKEIRSRELASIGGDQISALRRHLQGLGSVPPYATWKNARLIAEAGLAGKWDGKNQEDRAAIEMLLGKGYGEWIERLRPDALRSDSPLIQLDEKWRFVTRGEAWGALGNRITDEDLVRLQETVIRVLGERDPMFDLPIEERYAAGIYDKRLKHSRFLRVGLAETLALVGCRSQALSSCSLGQAENIAWDTVNGLLENTNWDRWASIDSMLPMLAEASPEGFLDAVESVLQDLNSSPFHELFAQEGSGGVGGGTYISGLLWALETLAWHPDLLMRVAVTLSDMASIDPGGNWTNRPLNSLIAILLPWHVQTCASIEKRDAVVKTILTEQPEVGWDLILGLLPHSHGSTSGCHRPTWRDYIPSDWEDDVPIGEYREQVTNFTKLAVGVAINNTDKLKELIDRLPELPGFGRESLLEQLASKEIVSLAETERLLMWEGLERLVRQHRKYADAEWALPKDIVARVSEVANIIAPLKPELRFRYLFCESDSELTDDLEDYEEQLQRLARVREVAIREIVSEGSVTAVLAFSRSVTNPNAVGGALGRIACRTIEEKILPKLLDSQDEVEKQVVSGFAWDRFRELGWEWVDRILGKDWTKVQKSEFLSLLPFEDEVWVRVRDQLGEENESTYWRNVVVNPLASRRDPNTAIERLTRFGRAPEAISVIYWSFRTTGTFVERLAVNALLATLNMADVDQKLDVQAAVDVIGHLQNSPTVGSETLFKIEWDYLPLLGRFSDGSPVTLERRLASDPDFFAEVIALVFLQDEHDPDDPEPNEHTRNLAEYGYSLLREWKTCPGTRPDGSLDSDAFKNWMEEVRRKTKKTGYGQATKIQIGQILTHAPPDPNGLWIHHAVATELNAREAEILRSEFTSALFNQRGVYSATRGEEECRLARKYRQKADDLDGSGFSRFATAMRKFAKRYERQSEYESKRSPLED